MNTIFENVYVSKFKLKRWVFELFNCLSFVLPNELIGLYNNKFAIHMDAIIATYMNLLIFIIYNNGPSIINIRSSILYL